MSEAPYTCEVRFFGGPLDGTRGVYADPPPLHIFVPEKTSLSPAGWRLRPGEKTAKNRVTCYVLTPWAENDRILWYGAHVEGHQP